MSLQHYLLALLITFEQYNVTVVAISSNETRNSGLRPVFEELLGVEVVHDFVAKSWNRPVTEFFGTPPYTLASKPEGYSKKTRAGKPARYQTDGVYEHDHHRFDALGPVLQCPSPILTKFGEGDEEKHICGLSLDKAQEPANHPCVIISIGGANQWAFENIIGKALPHCHIHTLDCTVDGRIPEALKGQATFHKICIGTKDETVTAPQSGTYVKQGMQLQFMRWGTFTAMIGLEHPPDVMKMDIEGYEWSVLQDMAANAPRNVLPRSISLELHYETGMSNLQWYGRFRSPYEIGAWMDFMTTRGNYVLVDRNDNDHCRHCSEIVIAYIPFSQRQLHKSTELSRRGHARKLISATV
jgi:hypothetical protein